jgi:hypothetical protein
VSVASRIKHIFTEATAENMAISDFQHLIRGQGRDRRNSKIETVLLITFYQPRMLPRV